MIRLVSALVVVFAAFGPCRAGDLGIFQQSTDVGAVVHPGAVAYDRSSKTYTVSGSGENMWFDKDEFQYVWKRVSAKNVSLAADLAISGDAGDGHRKGVLMIRQSLETDSAYVNIARHGDGLTSLQYRDKKGANTQEVESDRSGPAKLRLEKRGDRFYMWLSDGSNELTFAGGSAKVSLHSPFYIGIGVCAHNKNDVQQVVFKNVELKTRLPKRPGAYSTVETVLMSTDARVGYVSEKRVQSAGWTDDGTSLTFTESGEQRSVPFSPLRTAAKVGAAVHSDPDGYTYFAKNGEIWRKNSGGSEKLTEDERTDSSPYLSPDGKHLIYLRTSMGDDVELRMMTLADRKTITLAPFVGGPESLSDHPWSPDGRRVVFVSYQDIR